MSQNRNTSFTKVPKQLKLVAGKGGGWVQMQAFFAPSRRPRWLGAPTGDTRYKLGCPQAGILLCQRCPWVPFRLEVEALGQEKIAWASMTTDIRTPPVYPHMTPTATLAFYSSFLIHHMIVCRT